MKEKQTNKQKGAWILWDRVTGVPPWSQSLVGVKFGRKGAIHRQ